MLGQDRKLDEDWFPTHMYPFQDKGHYYLFSKAFVLAIDMAICMPTPTPDTFREDERFLRIRNACFLTGHPELLQVLYRRLRDIIEGFPDKGKVPGLIATLQLQLKSEFPCFDASAAKPIEQDYNFEVDWRSVRFLVHDLELSQPILRAWILSDAEDVEFPEDPVSRYEGKHWDLVIGGPTFRKGDRRDWALGWNGIPDVEWRQQLNRKFYYQVLAELSALETEQDGEIL